MSESKGGLISLYRIIEVSSYESKYKKAEERHCWNGLMCQNHEAEAEYSRYTRRRRKNVLGLHHVDTL